MLYSTVYCIEVLLAQTGPKHTPVHNVTKIGDALIQHLYTALTLTLKMAKSLDINPPKIS